MVKQAAQGKSFGPMVVRLLKPVIRFAFARGLRFQELLEILKTACLEVASEQLRLNKQPSNVSRLSVMTGLQRKEVSKLTQGSGSEMTSGSVSLLSRIISQWSTDPSFSDRGKAKPLSFEGIDSEFADLVRSVSVDTNHYTVLFGLEQSGNVKKRDSKVVLTNQTYDASKSVAEGVQVLANDSSALFNCVTENIFERKSIPNLHITTSYDNICVEDLDQIRDWLLERGTAFHEEARVFLAKHDKDASPKLYNKKGGARVTLSAFSFVDCKDGLNED